MMRAADRSPIAAWRDPWTLAALAVALALRIAMARGGLWLDEAWSAVMAHEAASPVAVIAGIHHDNNHPLNSWWLQLVGLGAPPLLARALAIVCSVATILPAARFAARHSAGAGRIAAWLFALSPMLVLLGSEARGYAPMLLALVLLVERVDPAAERPASPALLAALGLLGTLGHLLMLPAILLVGLWLAIDARGDRQARLDAVARIRPALTASLAIVALLIGWAYAVQGGLSIGSNTPFGWPGFAAALVELVRLTLGAAWLTPLALGMLFIGPRPDRLDVTLWALLGLGLPLGVLLLHPANSHISRYYLLTTPVLLWLVAGRVAALFSGVRWARTASAILLAAVLLAMTVTDARLIATRRGGPDVPVRRVAADHPGPARILIGASRLAAVITVAAAEHRLDVLPVGPACVPADALLIDLDDIAPSPSLDHCGLRWTLVDYRLRPYRDGSGWALYSGAGLPAPGTVASGPRPAL
ncbi:MAG: hypothetical protein ABIQ98_07035 [Sphingomicrobium sp.]